LDTDFPADASSLFWKGHLREDTEFIARRYETKIKNWKRPQSLIEEGQTPSLWGASDVNPDAVQQGRLGDSWFLSAATALAEYPHRVKKLF
jgi:hypothetical protein